MEEFRKGMNDYGVGVNADEIRALFMHFDKDGSGTIIFDEFLVHIRVSFVCLYDTLMTSLRVTDTDAASSTRQNQATLFNPYAAGTVYMRFQANVGPNN